MDATNIIEELLICKQIQGSLAKQRAELEEKLLEAIKEDVSNQLSGNHYGAGTATVRIGDKSVKVVISKKVSWDNDLLKDVQEHLVKRGEDPSEYIDVKYSVMENKYKAWPSSLQTLFEPARTVDISKPTITVEA